MNQQRHVSIPLFVAAFAFACGGVAPVGKHDAGQSQDAGVADDAGVQDSGVDEDAGADAGVAEDAGVVDDAGLPDAGADTDGGTTPDAGDPLVPQATLTLNDIADAYRAFYAAELRWPSVAAYWDPRSASQAPVAFTASDTALFTAPTNLPACTADSRAPCWSGPFLQTGTALGLAPWIDPWGNPIRVALTASGAGIVAAPQGSIVLWSLGPDGLDQTGCTTQAEPGTCTIDSELLAAGQSAGGDDVAVVITPAFDPVTATQSLVTATAAAFEKFHSDTGLWPWASCGWDPTPGHSPEVSPIAFNITDTALLQTPDSEMCSDVLGLYTPMNWSGPYLWSDLSNLATGAALDGWGNPLMFALVRPYDGYGGGSLNAPDGAILIWSTGPDGIDQTGCSTGACAVDYSQLVQGLPSDLPSDDVILLIGPAD